MSEELKPCPFCNGEAALGMFNVFCVDCSASTAYSLLVAGSYFKIAKTDVDAEKEEIIKKWNTRYVDGYMKI